MSDYPGLDLWNLTQEIMVNAAEQTAYIPWEILEDAFGLALWEKFGLWMSGQTSIAGGPFPWDVERFLQGLPIID
jgi:hypothetical protein